MLLRIVFTHITYMLSSIKILHIEIQILSLIVLHTANMTTIIINYKSRTCIQIVIDNTYRYW